MSANNKAVLLARTNGGTAEIMRQLRTLTRFAARNNIKIVGKVTLPHCSADEYDVRSHLTALLGRRHDCQNFGMILITDLSRLSRRGVPHAMAIIKRLAEAGVAVLTPDLGVIDDKLWQSFPVRRKGWARWGRKLFTHTRKKELNGNASKINQMEDNSENTDTQGDGPLRGRAPRPHSGDGSPTVSAEERQ